MRALLMKNPHKVLPQLGAALLGSWGFLCTGLVRGWSSPGIPSLNETKNFEMSSSELAWIAAMPPLCALVGALAISIPLQYFGRRKTLMGISIPFFIGFMLMGFTYFGRHKAMLFVGRILSGTMNGATTPASQIYISECASPRVRGTFGSFTATALALGILVAYIIGAFVQWHVLAWILGCFPLVLFVGMFFMPETPIWLLTHNQDEEARKALQRLRGTQTDIEAEFQRIKANLTKTASQPQIRPRELLKGSVLKPLGISMALMFFQQFTGINAMVYYTVSIFKSAGSTIDKRYATIIVGIVQLVCTAGSGFLVDRYGRRMLLFCSGFVVSISLASMGVFFFLQHQWGEAAASASIGWLPLLSLVVFFISYSGGFANVPFIIMGELFPSRYRSILGPISSSFNLLCTFAVVRGFPDMQITMTKHGAFWFFMGCTLLSMVFVYFFLPETKGKTLEDIEKLFSKKYNSDGTVETAETADPKFAAASITVERSHAGDGNSNIVEKTSGTPMSHRHPDDSEDEEEDGSVVPAPVLYDRPFDCRLMSPFVPPPPF